MGKLLRLDEAAARLALSPVTLRRLIRSGQFTPVHPTGTRAVRLAEADVERFLRHISGAPIQTEPVPAA